MVVWLAAIACSMSLISRSMLPSSAALHVQHTDINSNAEIASQAPPVVVRPAYLPFVRRSASAAAAGPEPDSSSQRGDSGAQSIPKKRAVAGRADRPHMIRQPPVVSTKAYDAPYLVRGQFHGIGMVCAVDAHI